MKYLSCILISLFIKFTFSFTVEDCNYDPDTKHVQYICGVATGKHFDRSTYTQLYCNNYTTGIYRGNIRIVNFINCKRPRIGDEYFDVFPDLHVLNISNTGIKAIFDFDLKFTKYLEEINASCNQLTSIPANLFSHTSELLSLDFSHNQILKLDPFVSDNVRKLKKINFSFNSIEELSKRLFSNLPDLEYLDFSSNRIKHLEGDIVNYNKKLKSLNLNNNQIEDLSCEFMVTLLEASALEVSINSLKFLNSGCLVDNRLIDSDILISPDDPNTTLKVFENRFKWLFSSIDFAKLRHLNFSNSRMMNTSLVLDKLNTQIETLDSSNNHIGELTADTFQRFVNLTELYLRRTNLSNFQFATFYHQRNLEVLDISYNDLNRVDFHLFLRNFQNLKSLNLEGNNLTEIDSITRTHFPKLSTLAISKNNFTCEYLVKFLLQWNDLVLVDNPSNQTHMGGVDCFHSNSSVNANWWNSYENESHLSHGALQDLLLTNILLIITVVFLLMFTIIFGMLIFGKCHRVRNIYRRRFGKEPTESTAVEYRPDLNEIKQNNCNHLNVFS